MIKKSLFYVTLIFLLGGCFISRNTPVYLGGLEEKKYDFLADIWHNDQSSTEYADAIWAKKYGGFEVDSLGKLGSWSRNPQNMRLLFNTLKTLGLNRFITKDQYFQEQRAWCCNTAWEGKTLAQIVQLYLVSDTSSHSGDVYMDAFWNRRRKEENIETLYEILGKIDAYYHQDSFLSSHQSVHDTIYQLLNFDLTLLETDSIDRDPIYLSYFNYLKSIRLLHSAHDLVLTEKMRKNYFADFDSLLLSLSPDTISEEHYRQSRYNQGGWIIYGYGK